ncbi:hypothetical protein B296_00057513, partial [Ensete ventricosum]
MYAQSQQALKQVAAMGMGAAGASQAIYDSGFQNINAAAQQFMLLSGGRAFVGGLMAAVQPFGCGVGGRSLPSFQGLRVAPPATRTSSCSVGTLGLGLKRRSLPAIVVKAATVIAPKVVSALQTLHWVSWWSQYSSIKPLGDRVLVKIKSSEEKTGGGILLPMTAQSKPQGGEIVAVGEGKTIGNKQINISVEVSLSLENFDVSISLEADVIYSKYAGTELEFNGSKHLLLKEDDIMGILETDDIKDLKPLNDRVLIKVAEAEEKTAGGLLLTEAAKDKPSIGTV